MNIKDADIKDMACYSRTRVYLEKYIFNFVLFGDDYFKTYENSCFLMKTNYSLSER